MRTIIWGRSASLGISWRNWIVSWTGGYLKVRWTVCLCRSIKAREGFRTTVTCCYSKPWFFSDCSTYLMTRRSSRSTTGWHSGGFSDFRWGSGTGREDDQVVPRYPCESWCDGRVVQLIQSWVGANGCHIAQGDDCGWDVCGSAAAAEHLGRKQQIKEEKTPEEWE